jgi:hypothetical protein
MFGKEPDRRFRIRRRHQEPATMNPTLVCLPLLFSGPVEQFSPLSMLGIGVPTAPITTGASQLARHLDVTLTELDAVQVANLLGDGLPASIRDRLKGRIGKVVLSIRGDQVTVKAEKFRLVGDWLSRAEGTADLSTRKYKLKMWAFGGLVEAEGELPKQRP